MYMYRMKNFRDQEEGDEEEEEEEEEGGGPPMLGIIFGNIDEAGDLDEEYLDQEAKEHLAALTNSLTDPWVDIQESGVPSDVSDVQDDYDRKADSAEDYEDIQEDYVELKSALHSQDEEAISQDQSFYAQAALAGSLSRLEEDENYDEDEDYDKEEHVEEDHADKVLHEEQVDQDNLQTFEEELEVSREAELPVPLFVPVSASEGVETDNILSEKNTIQVSTKEVDAHKVPTKFNLPVLYEEDGKAVLRFSELFGPSEAPLVGRKEKRHQKRHSHPKDKYIFSHPEYLEDDDHTLLSSGSTKQGFVNRVDYPADLDRIEGDETAGNLSSDSRQNNHAFKSAQPMKEGEGDWHSILERIHVPSPSLQPINQEDWESAILWDAGCLSQVREDPIDTALESSGFIEEMDVDFREDDASCMKETDESWQASMESLSCDITKINQGWHTSRPVVLEAFSLEPSSKCNSSSRHPQLLRLDALPALREVDNVRRVADRLQKLKLQSSELLSESWVDNIIWDNESVSAKKSYHSKVIFNLQDNQMMFEVSEGKNGNHLRAHAAAMIVTPHLRSSNRTDSVDVHHLGVPSLARFNISNDKYYMNKKNPPQQKSSVKKRSVHGIKVMHSIPASKLQTMKPKLANKDLANFHRPKAVWYPHHNEVAAKEQGKLSIAGPMKVIVKTMGGKGSKLNVDAAESWESFKTKLLKKFRDLRTSEKTKFFYCGKELETVKSLAQQEVKPNSVLHLVRTKIHPWPKAQRLPGENKPTRPPGAFKKKSDLSVKDGHVFIAEYCEERPLLINNVGMGARLCTYYRKVSPTDSIAATLRNDKDSSVGFVMPLEPMEDSPFLGDIRPGETQACFETNMFRAPAFYHKVQHLDFLLVRSSKGKLSIRRIDRSFVIGQQEPHMEVLTPGSKTVQSYLHNRLLTYVYRGFRNTYKPGTVTRLRADEVSLQFPSLSEGFVKKHLRHCADFQRVSLNESWWVMKRHFRIPSEEELRRMLTPENVCTYESMQAGLYHLKRMGVSKFTHPSGLSAAMNQLPDEALVLAAASHLERELQITPWNLSCNFVAATMQGRGSLERLEITGAGDPSGRGFGFSYLRAAPKPPSSTALVEKKAAAARGGGAVTGTDADLRRLSMDAAREVLLKFNVPESQIEKLTRWHRIALVRKLSSEQAASGVKLGASALNKFARGQRMSFLQLQQQTREKCQEIWDRQARSLSATLEENSESEGEANEDLDSFAGDLENLLEAEEGETDEVASTKAKKEAIRGPGARRRALEAQREEEIEDEEAEAAELRRMLMEDDEAEEVKKKKKTTVISEKAPEEPTQEQNKVAADEKSLSIRKKKIIKRIIRTMKPDGTYTSKEILITDPKEVAQYLARKNGGENGSLTKEKKGPFLSKKFKQAGILKDGKKLKKGTKGEGGRDGVQLVCGACKQVGHMRTNKKVCPMYAEEAKANISRAENIEPSEPPVRQGIKITLKSAAGAGQEREQPFFPPATSLPIPAAPLPLKLPSLKIKLPLAGIIDVAAGSTSRAVENLATPFLLETSPADAPKVVEESARLIKKIKVQKRPSITYDKLHDHHEQEEVREVHNSHHSEMPLLADKQETPQSMYARYQSPYAMEAENAGNMLARQKEGEWFSPTQSEDRLQKERIEEIRRRKEKKRLKEEKERRKAREKEEKRRRRREEEEERERLRIERQRELEEQADAQRRMIERRKEEEWQEFLRRERRQREEEFARQRQEEEFERQRQQAAIEQAEREKARAKKEKLVVQAIRPPARDRRSSEWDRSVSSKRRSFVEEDDDMQEASEYSHQPKRRKGGEVLLANILEGIVDHLKKARDISFLFQKPVTKKDAPDYHDIIKNPMDLSTIRDKARKLAYKSRGQFRQDVRQIAENAHIYNDIRNPGIPPLADQLVILCDRLLRDKARELKDAEASIEWIGEESGHATSSRTTNRRTPRPR